MSTRIKIEDLSLTVNKTEILKGINLSFGAGKIYGLVGRNGSGKTMLMKCICGFVRPTNGYVEINGKRVGKDVDFPSDIGVIIETPGFVPSYSGMKNLKMLASIKKIIRDDDIKAVLEKVGLDYNDKRPVKKYSLGMRQRLGIAQAIMENPEILILDEPFNGLDKEMCKRARQILINEKLKGKTIILVSHNQLDIEEICDETYEIECGEITNLTVVS